jgi:hypothetical protein
MKKRKLVSFIIMIVALIAIFALLRANECSLKEKEIKQVEQRQLQSKEKGNLKVLDYQIQFQ